MSLFFFFTDKIKDNTFFSVRSIIYKELSVAPTDALVLKGEARSHSVQVHLQRTVPGHPIRRQKPSSQIWIVPELEINQLKFTAIP